MKVSELIAWLQDQPADAYVMDYHTGEEPTMSFDATSRTVVIGE